MSNSNEKSNSMAIAEHVFIAKRALNGITKKPSNAAIIVTYNDLVQLVLGNQEFTNKDRAKQCYQAIATNEKLQQQYDLLVGQLSFAYSGEQVAASSVKAAYVNRSDDKFSLKFKVDQTYPSQYFVILTIDHPEQHHENKSIALHVYQDKHIDCVYFPALIEGKSQLLLEEKEAIFQLLTDANSSFYLM